MPADDRRRGADGLRDDRPGPGHTQCDPDLAHHFSTAFTGLTGTIAQIRRPKRQSACPSPSPKKSTAPGCELRDRARGVRPGLHRRRRPIWSFRPRSPSQRRRTISCRSCVTDGSRHESTPTGCDTLLSSELGTESPTPGPTLGGSLLPQRNIGGYVMTTLEERSEPSGLTTSQVIPPRENSARAPDHLGIVLAPGRRACNSSLSCSAAASPRRTC